MRTTWILLAALVPLAAGCSGSGGGEDLSAGTVTHLPDGTGTGTAASGVYTVQLDVTGCSGTCVAGFFGSICTLGPADPATMTATQSGGHLTVQSASANIVVSDFSGGINADGTFDVGGMATDVHGQPVTVTSRAQGSLSGNTATGTVESQGIGTVDGSAIDCLQTLQISGSK